VSRAGLIAAVALLAGGCADLLGIGAPGRDPADVDGSTTDAATDAAIDAGVCVAQTTMSCYDGPAGTMGVGQCTIGTRTCNGDGTAWGECVGQGAPAVERCGGLADATDENCDGSPSCTGAYVRVDAPAAASSEGIGRIGADAAGNHYLLGDYYQAFTFGGFALPPGEQGEIFLAKRTAGGTLAWARGLAGLGWQVPLDLLVAPDGSTTVVGLYTTTENVPWMIGSRPLSTANVGAPWMFIARFDPSGAPVWASTIEGVGPLDHMGEARAYLAAAPAGGVFVAVSFGDDANAFFYGPDGGPGYTQLDVFPDRTITLLRLSATGTLVDRFAFSSDGPLYAGGVGVDGSGNIIVAGTNHGAEIDLGVTADCPGGGDGFFLKLGPPPDYEPRFCNGLPGRPERILVDALGFTYATGSQLVGATLVPFVAKMTSAGGAAWSVIATGSGGGTLSDVAVDAAEHVVVAGTCSGGALDFNPGAAGGDVVAGTGDTTCTAKYTAAGAWLWSKTIASSSARAVTTLPFGNVLVAGRYGGVVDFGGGPVTSSGADMFLLELRP